MQLRAELGGVGGRWRQQPERVSRRLLFSFSSSFSPALFCHEQRQHVNNGGSSIYCIREATGSIDLDNKESLEIEMR